MPKNLVEHFSIIEDPRRGRVAYDLTEILVIVTCALFAEVESFVDIADWAEFKEPWLRRFLALKNGVPSHDTLIVFLVIIFTLSRLQDRMSEG